MVLISPSFSGWNLAKTALRSSNSGKGPKNRPTNVSRLFIAESVHRVSHRIRPARWHKQTMCLTYFAVTAAVSSLGIPNIENSWTDVFVCLFVFIIIFICRLVGNRARGCAGKKGAPKKLVPSLPSSAVASRWFSTRTGIIARKTMKAMETDLSVF